MYLVLYEEHNIDLKIVQSYDFGFYVTYVSPEPPRQNVDNGRRNNKYKIPLTAWQFFDIGIDFLELVNSFENKQPFWPEIVQTIISLRTDCNDGSSALVDKIDSLDPRQTTYQECSVRLPT